MNTTGFPTSSDIYLEADGKKIAVVQSYTAKTTKTSRTVEAFGEDQPVATIPGQQNHVVELTRLYATDEAIRDGIDFHTLEDFSLVICKPDRRVISSIREAEPIGPKKLLDLLIIAPCTGNTLGKLACGITDTAVTMAAKAHLRNQRPLLIAPSTNDGLTASAPNLGALLSRKYIYFVPFGQDDPVKKPTSLVADFSLVADAAQAALEGRQLQPLLRVV